MTNIKVINDYLKTINFDSKKIKDSVSCSTYLALQIAIYAHRNQTRVNGEPYIYHPYRCFLAYRKMLNINKDNFDTLNKDLLTNFHLPVEGVEETILLHDVLEDTDTTLQEIKQMYRKLGLDLYFESYIEEPLLNITHDKNMPYEEYIKICMKHETSALAKFFDLEDNSMFSNLTEFDNYNYLRTQRYIKYAYTINNQFKFIENACFYRQKLKEL